MILPANTITDHYDLLVIGGGPAGLAAALSAHEAGLERILIIERQPELGGILPQCIHNGFGSVLFKQDMPGPMYAHKFIQSVRQTDIQVALDTAVVSLSPDRTVYITGKDTGYRKLSAGAIVLAMGCRERTRAQIKLPGTRPAGVFTAGTVQRLVNIEGFMPGEEFVILGSGDIGMIMARRLTLEGATVKAVLELLPFLTGLRRNFVQCLQDFNIPLYLQTTVKKIIGGNRVEALETVKVDATGRPIAGSEELIPCDTLMLSVGLIPENELSVGAGVILDAITGGPVVDDQMATNIPGIFAAGNVVTIYDLVDFVSQAGMTAGRSAAHFVLGDSANNGKASCRVNPGRNVRSLVPQKISPTPADNEKITLSFRAAGPIDRPVRIELKDSDVTVKSFKKRYARPAEMMTVELDAALLKDRTGPLTLDITEQDPV